MSFRKANTVLRGHVKSDHVYVIPNAVDTTVFRPLTPQEKKPPPDKGLKQCLISLSFITLELDDSIMLFS